MLTPIQSSIFNHNTSSHLGVLLLKYYDFFQKKLPNVDSIIQIQLRTIDPKLGCYHQSLTVRIKKKKNKVKIKGVVHGCLYPDIDPKNPTGRMALEKISLFNQELWDNMGEKNVPQSSRDSFKILGLISYSVNDWIPLLSDCTFLNRLTGRIITQGKEIETIFWDQKHGEQGGSSRSPCDIDVSQGQAKLKRRFDKMVKISLGESFPQGFDPEENEIFINSFFIDQDIRKMSRLYQAPTFLPSIEEEEEAL